MKLFAFIGTIGTNLVSAALAAGKELYASARQALIIEEGDPRFGRDNPMADLRRDDDIGTDEGETIKGAVAAMRNGARSPTVTDSEMNATFAATFDLRPELPEAANDDGATKVVTHPCRYVIVLGGKSQPACTTVVEGEEPHCPKCTKIAAELAARAAHKAQPTMTQRRCKGHAGKPCKNFAPRGAEHCGPCGRAHEAARKAAAEDRLIAALPEAFQRAVNANDDGASLKALLEGWQGEVKAPASSGSWQYAIVYVVNGTKRSVTVLDERLHQKILADKAAAAEKARQAQVEAARAELERKRNAPKVEAKPESKPKGKDKGDGKKGGKGRHQHAAAA